MSRLLAVCLCTVMTGCSYLLVSGPPVGAEAPSFENQTTTGRKVSLADYEGEVVVMDFFATWCWSCRKVSPHMQALHERLQRVDNASVLAIHFDDDYGDWPTPQAYLQEHGYTYPVIPDGHEIVEAFEIKLIPAILIVGTDGKVIHRQWGMSKSDISRFEKLIQEHLE